MKTSYMLPSKARLTKLLLNLAMRFPFLFSSRLKLIAKRNSNKSPARLDYEKHDDRTTEASLLDGKTTWRGVHLLLAVNKEEAEKIKRSIYKRDTTYASQHLKSEPRVGFFGSSSQNLGTTSFNGECFFSTATIAIKYVTPRYCSSYLLRLKNGALYLSMYVGLDSSATQKISSVDVSSIRRYISFVTFNPLSKNFSTYVDHDRHNQIDDYIYDLAKSVTSEVVEAALILLGSWGVSKKNKDLSKIADFSRDDSQPYFSEILEEETHRRSVIERMRRHLVTHPNVNPYEEYIKYNIPDRIGVDGIFIHTEDQSKITEYDQYINSAHDAFEKYAGFLYITSINNRLQDCGDQIGRLFGAGSQNSKSHLKTLIKQGLALNVIEEHVDALKHGLHWFDPDYAEHYKKNIELLSEKASELKKRIRARHDTVNSEVQLSNLGWVKTYSMLMFALVILQVLLPVISVDWSPTGIDKNFIYQNFLAFKNFLMGK
ncbi:hypothetical protein [Pseudomonas donghuensis]|uniref:hypothetical protein n=1 Tax=Pseudomonas donghuensis TaxID=1163398 RepID=UPI002E0DFED2|nr:hypothetical protein VP780_17985 [Pseudomonas donghuensis]